METIRRAQPSEFAAVKSFYYELIDQMQDAEHKPAWEKGVYPSDGYLRESVALGNLWLCESDGRIAAAMIFNNECNAGYKDVKWAVDAAMDQAMVIHALGVMPAWQGKGLAGKMVRKAVEIASERGQRAIRLDVLEGNLPAERLYVRHGFRYVDTLQMFYEDTGWTNFKLYEYVLQR